MGGKVRKRSRARRVMRRDVEFHSGQERRRLANIEHCTWAVLWREVLWRDRVTGRALSSAIDRHFQDVGNQSSGAQFDLVGRSPRAVCELLENRDAVHVEPER